VEKFKIKYFLALFGFLWAIVSASLNSQERTKLTFQLLAVWEIKVSPPMNNPEAVTVSVIGDVYIADTGNNRILKFNSKGEYQIHVGGFGWENNQFDRPVDVCGLDGLNIYVADYNNQRIQRYSKKLEFVSSLGNSKINQLSVATGSVQDITVGYPGGLAISAQGDLFYSDTERGVIVKINKFGRIENTFGGFAQGRGKLKHPTKLCVSAKNVCVVDEDRVVLFDYFGNYIKDIGETVLKKPSDVSLDEKERIFVSDTDNKTIFVFDAHGALQCSLLGFSFDKPLSLDVMRSRMYVLDNASVMVFGLSEMPIK
jgi:DNA-binding beta-propeller fold protein YncE